MRKILVEYNYYDVLKSFIYQMQTEEVSSATSYKILIMISLKI